MSTQETELPDSQERVGLKRKLTGPPRLLLGKSKSREKLEGKSQRRQRQAKSCDGTAENNYQENDGNESSLITHHSPQNPPEEMETQPGAPGDTTGILVTLEQSESKDENMETKTKITRSTSKSSIKRMFSSFLRCGKRKESENETLNPQKTRKNRNKAQHNMCNSMDENKLSDANKEVPSGKSKTRAFFSVWAISKRSTTSNVNLGRGCREQDNSMVFQEITAPKVLTFKKIYQIFPRRKKTPPIDQFECNASSASQTEVADQLNQSPAAALDISSITKEENRKEEKDIKAKSVPETFTFSAEVSVNKNIDAEHMDVKEIRPDQDVSLNEEEKQVLKSSVLDSEVLPLCCSGRNFNSEFPGTSSVGELLVLIEKPIKTCVKCRPVITIEHAYSSEEENMNEAPYFDGLTINGSWQHLRINSLTNNTLHPSEVNVSSELDHSRCNEPLLIQTAVSMVQAAIRGAVEQLTIEQQHNQINLDHA
ncbi:uncharacterized protein si:dkey-1h6.8 [Cyprinus carpio]|uniref:Uncharacterized protein si:dkey-1h6.8 n=1 Tax=Cyprinus carpio TaxID=7962 RepID=A0A9Q9Z9A8_CYPCA|nr:uncharacterized protein si:dkey-1h6.8 [Cyprinus carpio]